MDRQARLALIEKLAQDKIRAAEFLAECRERRELVGDYDDGTTLLETPVQRRTYEPPTQQPQQATVLDEAGWNSWADARARQVVMAVIDIVSDESGAIAAEERERVDEQISALKVDIEMLRMLIKSGRDQRD